MIGQFRCQFVFFHLNWLTSTWAPFLQVQETELSAHVLAICVIVKIAKLQPEVCIVMQIILPRVVKLKHLYCYSLWLVGEISSNDFFFKCYDIPNVQFPWIKIMIATKVDILRRLKFKDDDDDNYHSNNTFSWFLVVDQPWA